jgi:hypothetical protein
MVERRPSFSNNDGNPFYICSHVASLIRNISVHNSASLLGKLLLITMDAVRYRLRKKGSPLYDLKEESLTMTGYIKLFLITSRIARHGVTKG